MGESLIDFVPLARASGRGSEIDTATAEGDNGLPLYLPVAGGSPYNCAIAVARLGSEVSFAGTISTDFFGDHLVAQLRANGVGLSLVHRVDNPTTLAFVKKAADGSARYAFYVNDAADRALTPDWLPGPLPESAILQIGSISLIPDPEGSSILHVGEREHGRRVIALDPSIRETLIEDETDYRNRLVRALRFATLLKTSDEDLAWIYPDETPDAAVRHALEAGVGLVVVTKGADGSTAYTSRQTVSVPAVSVEVSDTIGAGDSFLAGLLVWLDERAASPATVAALDRSELTGALRFAGRVAAITCTRVGADPPRRDEVDRHT